MNQAKRLKILKRLKAAHPHAKSELNFRSPYELLVAVLLSAQATDKSVNKVTPALFKVANTPAKMAKLGETKLKTYIKTIGLYNSKAKNLIKNAKILIEKFNSKVPQTRDELESLPGIGRKSANVILNVAFGHPTIGIDTHLFRVCNRIPLAKGKTPLEVEKKLEKVVPSEFKVDVHHWLILHGRYTCTARNPKCAQCPIKDLCEYAGKT